MAEFRFAKPLEELARQTSWAELERGVRKANNVPSNETAPLDRRKLKKLAEGDPDVVMTLHEFEALDRFLEPLGHGLASTPLFEKPDVLLSIADAAKRVTFLPGSKPAKESRINLDRWDVKALAKVQRGVNRFGPQTQFDIRDVLLHEDPDDAWRSVTEGSWVKLLDDMKGPTIIVPGSGRATHASDAVLSRMFSVAPMTDDQDKSALPFHFVWPEKLDHVFPSAFRFTLGELAEKNKKAADAVRKHAGPALEVDGRVYLDRIRQSSSRDTYGVVVAQRRPGGQIWLVLAGITGPATYAAARLLDEGLPFDLRAADGECSPVYWNLVKATVKQDRSRRAQIALELTDYRALGAPQAWTE